MTKISFISTSTKHELYQKFRMKKGTLEHAVH